jgi:hypothetical protein
MLSLWEWFIDHVGIKDIPDLPIICTQERFFNVMDHVVEQPTVAYTPTPRQVSLMVDDTDADFIIHSAFRNKQLKVISAYLLYFRKDWRVVGDIAHMIAKFGDLTLYMSIVAWCAYDQQFVRDLTRNVVYDALFEVDRPNARLVCDIMKICAERISTPLFAAMYECCKNECAEYHKQRKYRI